MLRYINSIILTIGIISFFAYLGCAKPSESENVVPSKNQSKIEETKQEDNKEAIISAVDKATPILLTKIQGHDPEKYPSSAWDRDMLSADSFAFRQFYIATRPEFDTKYEIAKLEYTFEEAMVTFRNRLIKISRNGADSLPLPKRMHSVEDLDESLLRTLLGDFLTISKNTTDASNISQRAELLFKNNSMTDTSNLYENGGYILFIVNNFIREDYTLELLSMAFKPFYHENKDDQNKDGRFELVSSFGDEESFRESIREAFKVTLSYFGYSGFGETPEYSTYEEWSEYLSECSKEEVWAFEEFIMKVYADVPSALVPNEESIDNSTQENKRSSTPSESGSNSSEKRVILGSHSKKAPSKRPSRPPATLEISEIVLC